MIEAKNVARSDSTVTKFSIIAVVGAILSPKFSDAYAFLRLGSVGMAAKCRHLRNLKPSITLGSEEEEKRGVVAAIAFFALLPPPTKDFF